jgi:hypothetical protein
MKLFTFDYNPMVLLYSTPTRLSPEPLGLSRIMVPAKHNVGSPWERNVICIHPKVSQTNASCLFSAEHDNIITSLALRSITYQVSECALSAAPLNVCEG